MTIVHVIWDSNQGTLSANLARQAEQAHLAKHRTCSVSSTMLQARFTVSSDLSSYLQMDRYITLYIH